MSENQDITQADLVQIMTAGANALERGDFLGAEGYFLEAQCDLPKGRITSWITDWPPTSKEEHKGRLDTWLRPEFRPPTRSDALLGLAFATMGLGEIDSANFLLERSGYYLISPANLDDRKGFVTGDARWLKEYIACCRTKAIPAALVTRPGRFRPLDSLDPQEVIDLDNLDDEAVAHLLLTRRLRSNSDPSQMIRAREADEWFWYQVRAVVWEVRGHEGIVTQDHMPWLSPAASALVDHAYRRGRYGDATYVEHAFGLLEAMYGLGRWAHGDSLWQQLDGLACKLAKHRQFDLAVLFLRQAVRLEPPRFWSVPDYLDGWADRASRSGLLNESEKLLEDLLAFPRNYESGITDKDFEDWERHKKQTAGQAYVALAAEAERRGRKTLAKRYRQRACELGVAEGAT